LALSRLVELRQKLKEAIGDTFFQDIVVHRSQIGTNTVLNFTIQNWF